MSSRADREPVDSGPGQQPPPGAAERAAAGEQYNPGPPTVPRPAASVIVLRGGAQKLELLLVRRTPAAHFMGGVWVFPGGAVNSEEGAGEDGQRAAAIRELREEAGIALEDPAALVRFSRWITPAAVRTRFDTHFFLAPVPAGQEPRVDGQECVDLGWFSPQEALRAHEAGEIDLVFPTIKHLQQFSEFACAEDLLSYASGREVHPVEPRVRMEGEVARVLLPGDPGY